MNVFLGICMRGYSCIGKCSRNLFAPNDIVIQFSHSIQIQWKMASLSVWWTEQWCPEWKKYTARTRAIGVQNGYPEPFGICHGGFFHDHAACLICVIITNTGKWSNIIERNEMWKWASENNVKPNLPLKSNLIFDNKESPTRPKNNRQ